MPRKKPEPAALSRGQAVCAFIERYVIIPEGAGVGKPMILMPYQQRFILEVFDNPHGTRKAILSVARKNSKTTLIAAILLAYIVGPLAEPNSQVYSGAHSKEQAAIVYEQMAKMIRMHPDLKKHIECKDGEKKLVCTLTGVIFKSLSSDSTNALGLSPIAFVVDEGGAVRGPSWPLFDALHSGQAAHARPIEFVISTQSASDNDWLSLQIDDARKSGDPRVICHVYEAPAGCDLLDESAWRAANPSLGIIVSMDEIRGLAQTAARLPSQEASFRNLNLNQRVADEAEGLLTIGVWNANSEAPAPYNGEPVYVGLDLSRKADLTAAVVVWRGSDKRINVHPFFFIPRDGLAEKARRDGFDYLAAERRGQLRALPGAALDYDTLGAEVLHLLGDYKVAAVAFDRYRMDDLQAAMRRAGAPESLLSKFTPVGQGFVGFGPAVDALEGAALNRQLRHGGHPVLNMCVANARVIRDSTGNRKLDKRRETGRIDGAVALAMALAAIGKEPEPKPEPQYQMLFIG